MIALQQIAELDLGTRPRRNDRLLPGDVVRAILPTLKAVAEKSGGIVNAEIEPLVPGIRADQAQLQDALATLLSGALASMPPNRVAELSLMRHTHGAHVVLRGGSEPLPSIRTALAARVIEANNGSITYEPGVITIVLT